MRNEEGDMIVKLIGHVNSASELRIGMLLDKRERFRIREIAGCLIETQNDRVRTLDIRSNQCIDTG